MARIVVLHKFVGSDSGCCGHIIEVDGRTLGSNGVSFGELFGHPMGKDPRQFAVDMITEGLGAQHVVDLDWENCAIVDD